MYYCLSELSSKFTIDKQQSHPNWTFAELSKLNITSEQLHKWSAPIDLIEDYQWYLNQLSTPNNLSTLEKKIYMNCSYPKFGLMCQYELALSKFIENVTLAYTVEQLQRTFKYNSEELTCYTHLTCEYRIKSSCLDWTEVCDGKIDCLNNGIDEKHCRQLEINQCQDDEYQCNNGQCIPLEFYKELTFRRHCLDNSDGTYDIALHYTALEDSICSHSFLSRSCIVERTNILMKRIYSMKHELITNDCWMAFKCILKIIKDDLDLCEKFCENNQCKIIIENQCPELLYIPNIPIFLNDTYLVYSKNEINQRNIVPYICSNHIHYENHSDEILKVFFNNQTCLRLKEFPDSYHYALDQALPIHHVEIYYSYLFHRSHISIINSTSIYCREPEMYQCMRSVKCIPAFRYRDRIPDCPYSDDEEPYSTNDDFVNKQPKHTLFKCPMLDKWIFLREFDNGLSVCLVNQIEHYEDEPRIVGHDKHILSFQTICDGYTEVIANVLNGQNMTDETECQHWECNNYYTACDQIWNCPKGEDEIGCPSDSSFNCSANSHPCIAAHGFHMICLPIEQINDGQIDCLDAYDEPNICRHNERYINYDQRSNLDMCTDTVCRCRYCRAAYFFQNGTTISKVKIVLQPAGNCRVYENNDLYDMVSNSLMNTIFDCDRKELKHFSMNGDQNETLILRSDDMLIPLIHSTTIEIKSEYNCHRGIVVYLWTNQTQICLCPPSYYGSRCQYQNQRINLKIQFRVSSDSLQTLFVIVISLIDNTTERIVHSTEQHNYISMKDCNKKFENYFFYSNRSSDSTKKYFLHIDIYEKISLNYRTSFLYPLRFTFLPVYRLSLLVKIPRRIENYETCSLKSCLNGKCVKYSNVEEYFCQCTQGWTGKFCQIKHNCICSSDSLCLDKIVSNRSICICPLNKFGPRCYLVDPICENKNNPCQNGGQCIAHNDALMFQQKFVCICSKGFHGDRCESNDRYHLTVRFHDEIILFQSIFIHFIEMMAKVKPIRTTMIQPIHHFRQRTIEFFWSQTFHLIFFEDLNKNYYLHYSLNNKVTARNFTITVNPTDHCPSINEIFNETFTNLHILRRIKYYHLPCLNHSFNVSCFHDDIHLCLCYQHTNNKRLVNCFEFNHNQTFDCSGQSVCEHDGQCFQDSLRCPTRSICACPSCFYGSRCQFTTNGFGLSLDAILGYHIIPNLTFSSQSSIVKFSLMLIVVFFIAGLVDGIVALMIFQGQKIREIGCGLYLLGTSMTSIATTITLGLKYLILVLAQMNVITDRSFLKIQCYSLDFILRVFLSLGQWLDASVAIERTITVIQGIKFNKKKSKTTAKLVIVLLILMIIGTNVHDPFNRHMIEEENKDLDDIKRTWCIVRYSSQLQIYNTIVNSFHFFLPFFLNLFSAIVLLAQLTRKQSNLQSQRTRKEIFSEQFQKHKHLFISPVVLVILSIPRLVISYISKCLKSNSDSWLYLSGYFISFVPSIVTCFIFVSPSKFYKEEFRRTMSPYLSKMQQGIRDH
ncbi:unnamed protein product [Adineta ricciae]|uniref:Uncharacterized protein n=1 Tax=Adineta ricciae TaxID=249248 RepID=A0A815S6J4_ADIRI|nr:unnamed protein product [Adineta ricciae]